MRVCDASGKWEDARGTVLMRVCDARGIWEDAHSKVLMRVRDARGIWEDGCQGNSTESNRSTSLSC